MIDIKLQLEREARELDESEWAHEARIMRDAAKRIEALEAALAVEVRANVAMNNRMETLIDARNATIARASRYEAVLRRIASCVQSGPLWARHNVEDEMGGVSEPDFEGHYDHFIALAREALEDK